MMFGVVNVHGGSLQHPEDRGQHVTFHNSYIENLSDATADASEKTGVHIDVGLQGGVVIGQRGKLGEAHRGG